MTALTLSEALAAARETRSLEIGSGIMDRLPMLFRQHFPGKAALVVTDESTFAAAGKAVLAALQSARVECREPFLFRDPELHAEYRFIDQLEPALRESGGAIPVSVGSGTINDLTKLCAHLTGRQYLCVATAASMDGYTAYGASIIAQGSKQTFDCPAPVAVLADLEIIRGAPGHMNGWGYADLLAKVTAGADWVLADAMGVEPIDELPWSIVQGGLRAAVSDPAGVRAGDADAVRGLVEGLMLGGFAMQASRSSRPASGAEHQFSHLWDMSHHTHNGYAPSHGLKVGIGTIAVTALYEFLMAYPMHTLDPDTLAAAWPDGARWQKTAAERFTREDLQAVATREIAAKAVSRGDLRAQLVNLRSKWPDIAARLRAQLIPLTELRAMLAAAGAATRPEEIGISRERLRESFFSAFLIRRRFTVLDLAVRAGLLDTALDSLFAPGGALHA